MAKSKLVETNEKIAKNVTSGFKDMSDGVVNEFNKLTENVVNSYTKIEDKFVEKYLTKDGESIEDAKNRIKKEEQERRNSKQI